MVFCSFEKANTKPKRNRPELELAIARSVRGKEGKMASILVDMDGPLVNFLKAFKRRWAEKHPNELQLDFEIVQEYWFQNHFSLIAPHLGQKIDGIWNERNLFESMEPVQGALEALEEMRVLGHEVFICTTPIHVARNPYCAAEKYASILKDFGHYWAGRIILTDDKTLIRGDYLIDDKPEVTGILQPEWKHIIYDAPYNRHITGQPRLKHWRDWREVLQL
jgi:5'-nucleotidase